SPLTEERPGCRGQQILGTTGKTAIQIGQVIPLVRINILDSTIGADCAIGRLDVVGCCNVGSVFAEPLISHQCAYRKHRQQRNDHQQLKQGEPLLFCLKHHLLLETVLPVCYLVLVLNKCWANPERGATGLPEGTAPEPCLWHVAGRDQASPDTPPAFH